MAAILLLVVALFSSSGTGLTAVSRFISLGRPPAAAHTTK